MDQGKYIAMRRRRVKRLKRMIIAGLILMILIPTALSVWLGVRLHRTGNALSEMNAQYESQLVLNEELQQRLRLFMELASKKETEDVDGTPEIEEVIQSEPASDDIRRVYLTFDDGPSTNTIKILDILDEYDVKATFFVTGQNADDNEDLYREIVKRGHTLGMHSYSHVYSDIYRSRESFAKDFNKIRDYLTDTTGVTPVYYRFPGGSSNTVSKTDMKELCEYVEENGATYLDWNISSGDATNPQISVNRLVNNCMSAIPNHMTAVILFHDAAGKDNTVKALPQIIEQIQAMEDTVILPITEDTVKIRHLETEIE